MDESLRTLKDNKLVEIAVPKTTQIELRVEDEYGMNKLRGHIEEYKRMMTRAEYGGCGKSDTCKSM
ncbi:MAG: hypothetical protein ACKPKO_63830 [Candidatus Fonsibacter sp.]